MEKYQCNWLLTQYALVVFDTEGRDRAAYSLQIAKLPLDKKQILTWLCAWTLVSITTRMSEPTCHFTSCSTGGPVLGSASTTTLITRVISIAVQSEWKLSCKDDSRSGWKVDGLLTSGSSCDLEVTIVSQILGPWLTQSQMVTTPQTTN